MYRPVPIQKSFRGTFACDVLPSPRRKSHVGFAVSQIVAGCKSLLRGPLPNEAVVFKFPFLFPSTLLALNLGLEKPQVWAAVGWLRHHLYACWAGRAAIHVSVTLVLPCCVVVASRPRWSISYPAPLIGC